MREIEPGFFAEPHDGPRPKGQIGIRIEVPEPGVLRHAYCWTDDEGRFGEVNVSELRVVS